MNYKLPVVYAPGGLDLRIPHTLRNLRNARDGLNFDITPSTNLVKRLGYQRKAASDVGYGLVVYEQRIATEIDVDGFGDFVFGQDEFGSPTTAGFGTIQNTLVGLDDTPKKWVRDTFDITYSGGNTPTITIRADGAGSVELILYENGSAVYTKDLGTGSEGSPVTLSALETEIDAVSDWAATTPTAATSVPAAFLDFQNAQPLTATVAYEVGFGYWQTINTTLTTPLSKTVERLSQSDYENTDAISVNGILYITNGFDELLKYDGQTCYRAGLPQGAQVTGAIDTGTSVGATFTGVWNYRITYEQKDAIGNIWEGHIATDSADLDNSAGPYAIDLTISNLSSATGYNTNCAVINGTQTSTNVATNQERLTVDDGSAGAHTLKVGDTAYLYDKNLSAYRELEVLAVTSSTVTLSSSTTISVDDNKIISNNLKINIYRAEVVGGVDPALSDYQLVETIPNNSFASTQSYKDEVIPANLGASYVQPAKTPYTPPRGKYLTQWRNQLIVAGDPSQPTRFYYSEFADVTSPENFPASNFADVPQGGGGRITGIASLDRNLFVFLQNRIYVVEGNLAEDVYRVDTLSDSVGCVAHATIKEIDGNIIFLSEKGVYRIYRASTTYAIQKISGPLDPILEVGANNDFRSSHKRATSAVWIAANKYMLFLPSETTSAGVTYADSDSRVFVYDIDNGEWYRWNNINALGGMVEFDDGSGKDVIWFQSRNASSVNPLHRFNLTNSEIDYADHVDAVDFSYLPQWDFQQAPNTRKIYSDIGLDTFKSSAQLAFDPSGDITITTYRDFNDAASEVSFTVSMPSDDMQVVEPLPRRQCRSLGVKFTNSTINKQVVITGWSYEVLEYDATLRRR